MVKSKEWNWQMVQGDKKQIWLEPSVESYYCVERWKRQGKKDFLDLGCGLGRHSILFAKNGFKTHAFDLSEFSVQKTYEFAKQENLEIECQIGDMLNLPYASNEFDCIYCYNVISHSDTKGVEKTISEIKRVLKNEGEIFLTFCSKETWSFKQDWPKVDENTKLRMDEGPEKGVPHFYADYELIKKLFANDFEIIFVHEMKEFYQENNKLSTPYHYHILLRKKTD